MKKISSVVLIVLCAVSGFADEHAVHGMLLFGQDASYVSHLPMFHSPHDYQFIASVELAETGAGKTVSHYQRLRNSNSIFTIAPKPMDLSEVVSGKKTSFEVTIYKGHFERGGTPLGAAIVKVKQILIGQKIAREQGLSTEFLSFGSAQDYYLAHVITGQPTYDAIYKTSAPARIYFPPCGRALCPEPIRLPVSDSLLPTKLVSEQSSSGVAHPHNSSIGSSVGVQVEVTSPFYVEYEELAH